MNWVTEPGLQEELMMGLARNYGRLSAQCPYPVDVRDHRTDTWTRRPCRQCVHCKVRQGNEQAARHIAEAKTTESMVAMLSISPDAIRKRDWTTKDAWRLECDAMQKRLRRRYGSKCLVRFVAEFGGETFRPHGHAIIHGVDVAPMRRAKYNNFDWWPHGNVGIDKVHSASVGYVIGYFNEDDKKASRIFSRTSKGIGMEYFNHWLKAMKEGRKKHGAAFTYYPDPKTGLLEIPCWEIDHRQYVMDPRLKEKAKEAGIVCDLSERQQTIGLEITRREETDEHGSPLQAAWQKEDVGTREQLRHDEVKAGIEFKRRANRSLHDALGY